MTAIRVKRREEDSKWSEHIRLDAYGTLCELCVIFFCENKMLDLFFLSVGLNYYNVTVWRKGVLAPTVARKHLRLWMLLKEYHNIHYNMTIINRP